MTHRRRYRKAIYNAVGLPTNDKQAKLPTGESTAVFFTITIHVVFFAHATGIINNISQRVCLPLPTVLTRSKNPLALRGPALRLEPPSTNNPRAGDGAYTLALGRTPRAAAGVHSCRSLDDVVGEGLVVRAHVLLPDEVRDVMTATTGPDTITPREDSTHRPSNCSALRPSSQCPRRLGLTRSHPRSSLSTDHQTAQRSVQARSDRDG